MNRLVNLREQIISNNLADKKNSLTINDSRTGRHQTNIFKIYFQNIFSKNLKKKKKNQ